MKIYRVKSETDPNKTYLIRHYPETDKFVCLVEATGKLCPAYAFSKVGSECKHIKKVKKHLKI